MYRRHTHARLDAKLKPFPANVYMTIRRTTNNRDTRYVLPHASRAHLTIRLYWLLHVTAIRLHSPFISDPAQQELLQSLLMEIESRLNGASFPAVELSHLKRNTFNASAFADPFRPSPAFRCPRTASSVAKTPHTDIIAQPVLLVHLVPRPFRGHVFRQTTIVDKKNPLAFSRMYSFCNLIFTIMIFFRSDCTCRIHSVIPMHLSCSQR